MVETITDSEGAVKNFTWGIRRVSGVNYHNFNFKAQGYLIFPVLARLCVLHQIINTYDKKEQKSTSRSVLRDLTERLIVKN